MVTFDEAFKLVKVSPLVDRTDQEVENYIAGHGVLVNPMLYEGHPSIGCAPARCGPPKAPTADAGRKPLDRVRLARLVTACRDRL